MAKCDRRIATGDTRITKAGETGTMKKRNKNNHDNSIRIVSCK